MTLEPAWKFCVMCGAHVEPNDTPPAANAEPAAAPDTQREPVPGDRTASEPIPAVFRPVNVALDDDLDDEIPAPRKLDAALIFGIVMAVGGAVLIIFVAIALFTPRG